MKNEILSQKIKTMRSLRNMTQKDFAAYIGIPQPTLSAYENGKNNPTVNVLVEIADKCGVSLDWLCGRETNSGAISSMSDVVQLAYNPGEFNDISFEIDTEKNENPVTPTFNEDDKALDFKEMKDRIIDMQNQNYDEFVKALIYSLYVRYMDEDSLALIDETEKVVERDCILNEKLI